MCVCFFFCSELYADLTHSHSQQASERVLSMFYQCSRMLLVLVELVKMSFFESCFGALSLTASVHQRNGSVVGQKNFVFPRLFVAKVHSKSTLPR